MQPLPPDPPLGAGIDLFVELLDAKWVLTTVIATYAAVVATIQAFKDEWLHRPRIRLILYPSLMGVPGSGLAPVEMLSLNIINEGYKPRRIYPSVSYQIKEAPEDKKTQAAIPMAIDWVGDTKNLLQPSDFFTAHFARNLVVDSAREYGISGAFHVRAFVQDGTNRRFDSGWVKIDPND